MIKNTDTLSPYQIAMIVIMTLIGVGIFSLPSQLAETAGTDAWFIIILGGLVSLVFINIIIALGNRFPGRTLPEYIEKILGKFFGKIIIIAYIVYFIIFMAYEIRVFNEIAKMFLLFRTPSEVIIIGLILACTYAVRGGVECIGRTMELFFPLLFFPLILIILPGLAHIDKSNIFPVFYRLPPKIIASLPRTALSFAGYEVLLFYAGFSSHPKKNHRNATLSIIFITAIYGIITVLCFLMFGEKYLKVNIWPLLAYVKAIDLPGLFIERLDGIMLSIWILTVFTTMISLYYIVTYSLSKLFKTKEQKQFALPLVPLIYYISLLPENIGQLDRLSNIMFHYISSIMIFIIPSLLLLMAKVRKLRGDSP